MICLFLIFDSQECYYCGVRGANLSCGNKKCKRSFHLPCAIGKDCLFQFHNTFSAFCHEHHCIVRPEDVHRVEDPCLICRNRLGGYLPVRSVKTPCCSIWLHKLCLMRAARSPDFRCPSSLCTTTNQSEFQENMKLCGIFVPHK